MLKFKKKIPAPKGFKVLCRRKWQRISPLSRRWLGSGSSDFVVCTFHIALENRFTQSWRWCLFLLSSKPCTLHRLLPVRSLPASRRNSLCLSNKYRLVSPTRDCLLLIPGGYFSPSSSCSGVFRAVAGGVRVHQKGYNTEYVSVFVPTHYNILVKMIGTVFAYGFCLFSGVGSRHLVGNSPAWFRRHWLQILALKITILRCFRHGVVPN